jgi:predicted metal-dependent phosphoesterase TrpH
MRLDLHVHTYYSHDAISSPEDIAKAAIAKGLDGIAITDHDSTRGWKRMLDAGRKNGLGIVLGEEIKVTRNGKGIGEVLALFINEEIGPGEFLDVRDRVREQGGLVIASHPFDAFRNRFKRMEEFKRKVDGVEAFNARVVLDRFNQHARDFARKNRLAMTGGSDAHCLREIGNGQTIAGIDDVKDLHSAIKKRKTRVWGRKSTPLIHAVSTLAKLGVMGRR